MEDAVGVWTRRCGPFMWGRIDATDDGWTHNGKLIRFFRLRFHHTGVHLYTQRSCYALYWTKKR